MQELWSAIAEVSRQLHRLRVKAIAGKLRSTHSVDQFGIVRQVLGASSEASFLDRLEMAWRKYPGVSSGELATALEASSHTAFEVEAAGSVDLVWTGPSTGVVPVRHTEQALCEVIDSSRYRLFLVSFVAYQVAPVERALREAVGRHVQIDVLVESSKTHGGTVDQDSVEQIKSVVPSANTYVWHRNLDDTGNGKYKPSVHAKCAVADGVRAFVTSANLTRAAFERNMEVGVLVKGGPLPDMLDRHLEALITTGIIEKV